MRIYFEDSFPEFAHSYGNAISIPLDTTNEINLMIDKVRAEDGKTPLFNKINGMEIDSDNWYEVRLILDSETGEPQELEAWVVEDADDDSVYHFDIDDPVDVKRQVMDEMKHYGYTVDELRGKIER